MLYINDDNNLNYKYVVSYSDNYVVLSNQRYVYADYTEPEDLILLVQYFSPSDLSFKTTQTFYNDRTFTQIDVTNSDWQRKDISNIMIVSFFIIILTIFVYNILSKIFVRGGFCR